jgi:hypothetical protein
MIDRLLQTHLAPIARGGERWRLWRALMLCWAVFALLGLGVILLRRATGWSTDFIFFLLIIAAVGAAWVIANRFRRRPLDYRAIARQIEEQNPELHALLLTAVEQVPVEAGGELNYLQQRVVLEAIEKHRRSPWGERIAQREAAARRAQWLTLLLFGVVLFGLRPDFRRGMNLWADATRSNGVTVQPGDANIERGSGLVVLARFEGSLPAEAELVINPVNENERRVPLAKNMADPVFGGGVTDVKTDLKYHIEYSTGRTRDFKVTVFDFPRLERADATLTYPAYTSLPEKTIKDTRRISAVEGSKLDYAFFLNKPVVKAQLVAKDQSVVPLTAETNSPTTYHTKIELDQTRRYELVLVDDAGRTNKFPPEFVLEALKNRPPQLRLASPRGDQRVSALEEIAFQGEASDDFGLKSYGIAYSLDGGETRSIELGKTAKPNEKRQFNYLLALEDLKAQPDQLLSYYVWAEDVGPDGQARRNEGDMYFAEIRPFDEIFREGQQAEPSSDQNQQNNNQGGQRGGSQQDRLTDLQKQIITATWNIKRRETASKPSDKFKDDLGVVKDSQQQALDQVREMKDANEDPRLQPFIETAEKAMDQAVTQLGNGVDKNSLSPLSNAITNEQSAYQALLKLSAREFQVTRGQRGQRGGQQANQRNQRAQRQLDQLDLQQTANRYETQRQANAQQNTPEQQEQLQVANRLKELAQRQQDLNERVRELQAALQEARTEQERQQLQDRLKRLREEQQDLLADVDELRQRMDRPENQQRMADDRQQLDQTRSQVQQAAESLQQGQVSQALNSGTRAQRDLQKLQDDFRRRNSSQFSDDMKKMREDARNLAQREQDIQKKMDEIADPKQKTLSETEQQRAERLGLANQLLQQRDAFTNLFNEVRQVSEQSETAEPLLSQQLYDIYRQTGQDELNQSLEQSSDLVRRGFVPQASPFEERARQTIDQVRQRVERAAESVLGDGTEALRLARQQLDDLNRELDAAAAGTNTLGQTNGIARAGRGQRGDGQNSEADPSQQANAGEGQDAQQPGGQGQGRRGGVNRAGQPQEGDQQQANAAGGQDSQQPGRGGRGNRGQGGGRDGQQQEGDQQLANGQQNQDSQQPGRGGRGNRGGAGGQAGQPQEGDQQQANAGNQDSQDPNQRGGRGGRGGAGNRDGQPQPGGELAGGGPGRRDGERGGNRVGGANYGGGGGNYWDGGYWDPILGQGYVDWTDRLRAVEEMVDVPEISAEVARIRDRVTTMRRDFKKAGTKPEWAVVHTQISTPLAEIRARVNEELLKRESKDALVPLDRDPVPSKYSELVRRYYEQLGKSDQQ